MEHQQVEKIFAGDGSGVILFAPGVHITECNRSVVVMQNILFLDNAFIQVLAKIDDSLITIADISAMGDPILRSGGRYNQSVVDDGLTRQRPVFSLILAPGMTTWIWG